MPTVNELLDKAIDELSNLLHGEVFLYETCLRDMSGIGFLVVIDCYLVPYFSII